MYNFFSKSAYPLVMALGLLLYWILIRVGFPAQSSTYIAVGFGALVIILLEATMPYRESWKENGKDLITDGSYMAIVQVLIPRLVSLFIALNLITFFSSQGWSFAGLWPHHYPIYIQVILMLVIGDFFRYWIHRLVHNVPLFWRFHAVHHSPDKLYWLNVGRFHALEKFGQFLFDFGPFIILGVSEHVLAAYLVFYAINGFFQHCNINLKLGPLNYIISGPELHHWHHSKVVGERNQNYGNNLIIWDLLFGTWYLPKEREVGALGLTDDNYPQDFVRQQYTPFTRTGK